MVAQQNLILGLDFGGTKLAAGVFEPHSGRLLQAAQVETRAALGAAAAVADMLALVRTLRYDGKVTQVGVSFGGHVRDSQIIRSLHVAGWEDYPLAQALRQHFGVAAVRIANDANATALGEWKFGAGRGAASMLFVTVSTGIGGAVIVGGKLWEGAAGMAGEIGHMQLATDGPLCTCGRRGCLEALAAGPAIARRAAALGLPGLTAREVACRANDGDRLAQQALVECAGYLGRGLANAINLLDVERVVIGGGVTGAGALWWDAVRVTALTGLLPRSQSVEIVRSGLGDYAGVWGAAALMTADGTNAL
jgi:glucokinase